LISPELHLSVDQVFSLATQSFLVHMHRFSSSEPVTFQAFIYLIHVKAFLMDDCLLHCVNFTGHLAAPLFAHIFCNYMGLPVLYANGKGKT